MTSNAELIRKADLVISELSSNGGLLNPEQSNAFIRKLLVAPTMLAQVRRVTMSAYALWSRRMAMLRIRKART